MAATRRKTSKTRGKPKARRVVIYLDTVGEYRYRVQSANWREIEASEQGFKQKATITKRIKARWPKVEVRDLT